MIIFWCNFNSLAIFFSRIRMAKPWVSFFSHSMWSFLASWNFNREALNSFESQVSLSLCPCPCPVFSPDLEKQQIWNKQFSRFYRCHWNSHAHSTISYPGVTILLPLIRFFVFVSVKMFLSLPVIITLSRCIIEKSVFDFPLLSDRTRLIARPVFAVYRFSVHIYWFLPYNVNYIDKWWASAVFILCFIVLSIPQRIVRSISSSDLFRRPQYCSWICCFNILSHEYHSLALKRIKKIMPFRYCVEILLKKQVCIKQKMNVEGNRRPQKIFII